MTDHRKVLSSSFLFVPIFSLKQVSIRLSIIATDVDAPVNTTSASSVTGWLNNIESVLCIKYYPKNRSISQRPQQIADKIFSYLHPLMKDGIIPILILISISVAAVMFNSKNNRKTDDIDKMGTALNGVQAFLKPGSNISFQNGAQKAELHFWARLVLTPNYLANKPDSFDTLLTVCSKEQYDSMNNDLQKNNRHILWQNKDDQYCYILTATH